RLRVHDRFQRLAETGRAWAGVGNLIVLALVLEWALAREYLTYDRDIFAGARERLAVGDTMPPFDHLRAGRADAEEKAVARERLQTHRRHRGAGRGTALHLHDAGADFELARAREHPRRGTDRVAAPRFAGPGGVVAEPLGLEHHLHVELGRGPRGA